MNVPGITWCGESLDDVQILRDLPPGLVSILGDTNGFIVREGALHVRGASLTPDWHSLRAAWRGPSAFHELYPSLQPNDIPFAQDQVGDQLLIRGAAILRLSAETGEVEPLAKNLDDFFHRVGQNIEEFLNVGLSHTMQPGELLLASPPLVLKGSATSVSLKAVPAGDVILFHADLARQIRDVPDGGRVEFKFRN